MCWIFHKLSTATSTSPKLAVQLAVQQLEIGCTVGPVTGSTDIFSSEATL